MEQAIYWLTGALGVPLINWLKRLWGLEDKAAMWLTLAIAAILGTAALLMEHEFAWDRFNPENLLAVVGQVLAAATLAYQLLRGK